VIEAGNRIEGPAIIESVATTFAIPPGRSARLDSHHIFHLSAAAETPSWTDGHG
jgi:N-methylhydantoinase A/oxoprolinase/acetone carboxylase beta subunit